jgi:hypothetical protein
MKDQNHNVEFADEQPLPFLVDRHWWILTTLYTDEQGQVYKLEGKYSEGHPGREIFDPSQVRDSTKIIDKVYEIEQRLRGDSNDDYPGYVSAFADGHKPGCLMASPIVRNEILESRENRKEELKKKLKQKELDVDGKNIEVKLRAILCTCDNDSKD